MFKTLTVLEKKKWNFPFILCNRTHLLRKSSEWDSFPYCLCELEFWFKIKKKFQKIFKCIVINHQELSYKIIYISYKVLINNITLLNGKINNERMKGPKVPSIYMSLNSCTCVYEYISKQYTDYILNVTHFLCKIMIYFINHQPLPSPKIIICHIVNFLAIFEKRS